MKSRGFTLIELAIVMIVIGLLTAGVLMGQTLIRQSELSGVVTTLEKISSVTRTFQKKYQYLPGDLPDATSFWGIQAGTGNDDVCYLSESTTQTTCNGNGDGIVNRGHTNTGWHERTRYWQQLANEGLITGRYTGVQGLDGSVTRAGGVNVMKAEWENTNYGLGWNAFIAADPNYYEQSLQHHISNALDWRAPDAEPTRKILTPGEQYNLDAKIDDGKPGTGVMRTVKPANAQAPNCSTNADPAVAMYNTALDSKECFFIYLMGF